MVVRHPLIRLVSAYKDRLINQPDSFTATNAGVEAVLAARPWLKKDQVSWHCWEFRP